MQDKMCFCFLVLVLIYSLVQPDFVWVPAKLYIFCFCFLFLKKVGTFQYTVQNPSYGVGSQIGVIRGLWHLQTHNRSVCETTFCIYCASSYLHLLDTTDRKWIYTHSKSEGSKINWRANEEVRNRVFHYEKLLRVTHGWSRCLCGNILSQNARRDLEVRKEAFLLVLKKKKKIIGNTVV